MASREDMEIDIHRLHLEWQKQPRMYHEYAEKLSKADTEVDRLKGAMELVEAQMFMAVKDEPTRFGLKKVPSDKIAEIYAVETEEYQEAQDAYNRAKAIARHLRGMINTLEQRKVAVEYLSRLRLADYYADPRITVEERMKEQEGLRDRVVRKMGADK